LFVCLFVCLFSSSLIYIENTIHFISPIHVKSFSTPTMFHVFQEGDEKNKSRTEMGDSTTGNGSFLILCHHEEVSSSHWIIRTRYPHPYPTNMRHVLGWRLAWFGNVTLMSVANGSGIKVHGSCRMGFGLD